MGYSLEIKIIMLQSPVEMDMRELERDYRNGLVEEKVFLKDYYYLKGKLDILKSLIKVEPIK